MPDAERDLADVWLAAPDRNAVSRVSHEIDMILGTDPHAVGAPLFATVYELTRPPLGVEYEVSDPDRLVSVLSVWDSALGRPNPTGN